VIVRETDGRRYVANPHLLCCAAKNAEDIGDFRRRMSTDSGNPARSGSELGSECGLGSKHISAACNHICPKNNSEAVANATILDGAVMVQVLNNGTSRTFQDYRPHSLLQT